METVSGQVFEMLDQSHGVDGAVERKNRFAGQDDFLVFQFPRGGVQIRELAGPVPEMRDVPAGLDDGDRFVNGCRLPADLMEGVKDSPDARLDLVQPDVDG